MADLRIFLKRLLPFLAISAVLYGIILFVLANVAVSGSPLLYRTAFHYKWPGGTAWPQFHEYDQREGQDAVILGSSVANMGYDTQVFGEWGYKVFNLGSKAQTPWNSYYLIKRYLDGTNCPLLIYDVYGGIFIRDGYESAVDLIVNQPKHGAQLGMARIMGDIPGLNVLSARMLALRDSALYTSGEYRGRGFSTFRDSSKVDVWDPDTARVEIPVEQQRAFEGCIRLCRERGIRLVAVSSFARSNHVGKTHELMRSYMDSVQARHGIPYIDFSTAPGIEDYNWFYDSGHLNSTGARIFSERLVDSLEARGFLAPGRW